MMMMKSVFWWRKPEYPEETTDLRQVTDETFHTYGHKMAVVIITDRYRVQGRGNDFFLGGGGKSVDMPSDCQMFGGGAQAYPSH